MNASDCLHENFTAKVAVDRLTDEAGLLAGFYAVIRVTCADCKTAFVWLGVPMTGMTLDGVAVSPDGEELRAALAPSFAWAGPGKDISARGFSVRRVV